MDLLAAIGFYLVGIIFVIIEVLTPGMILGIIGAGCMVVSVIVTWPISTPLAVVQIAIAVIFIPSVLIYAANKLQLKKAIETKEEGSNKLSSLVGRTAEAVTDLKPSGFINIDGMKLSAYTVSEYIDKGKQVKIVGVEGEKIYVR